MFANLLRAGLLALIALAAGGSLAAPPVAGGEPVGFGLIVGYRDAVNPLSREETDRGPWADQRARMASAWQRATQRSRERTAQLARDTGVRAASVGEAGRAALLRFDRPMQGRALADALRRVRLDPDVAWVEPNVFERRTALPTDGGYYALQWHLHTSASEPTALNLPPAWDMTTGLASTVVAVVDSGVRFDHPDLAGKLVDGHDFVSLAEVENDGQPGRDNDASDPGDWVTAAESNDAGSVYHGCTWDGVSPPPYPAIDSSWHGTFIAGQIAAATNNSFFSVAGINWAARVLPVRVSGKCGALVSDLLDGVRWAAGLPVAGAPTNDHPARVINLSFNGNQTCSAAYQQMVDDVTAAGALLVVAAGNNAAPLTRPADCSGVMAVASVQRDGAKAPYSNFGANVALSAPGGWGSNAADPDNIFSLSNDGTQGPGLNTYAYKMGTSFAAPQAAGVASLMLAINPQLTPQLLTERMKNGTRPHLTVAGPVCGAVPSFACRCTTTTCGTGLLDAHKALLLAAAPIPQPEPEPAPVASSSGGGGGGGAFGAWWGLALGLWGLGVARAVRPRRR